jgi:hypothetical protein
VADTYTYRPNRLGGRRKVIENTAAPKAKRVSPSSHRRIVAESVYTAGSRIQLSDFAHVRTKLNHVGRTGYEYRGAGDELSPRQLAAARRNLERARAAKRGR